MKRFLKYASPYQAINILTGLLIVCVLGYSAFYSYDHRDHPIGCVHVAVSGLECSTCGLSQSFSMMIRGNYESAMEYNRNGPLLFGFLPDNFFYGRWPELSYPGPAGRNCTFPSGLLPGQMQRCHLPCL
jgi:hypothetical protein